MEGWCSDLLEMISQREALQGGTGTGVVGDGVGVGGCIHTLLFSCHSWPMYGQDKAISPLGNMQSFVRLLSQVPRGSHVMINFGSVYVIIIHMAPQTIVSCDECSEQL